MPAPDLHVTDKKLARSLLRQFKRNLRDLPKRIENDPWVHEYRRVKAEVERTGNDALFADFERRFLQAMALLYPPEACSR